MSGPEGIARCATPAAIQLMLEIEQLEDGSPSTYNLESVRSEVWISLLKQMHHDNYNSGKRTNKFRDG